MVSLWVKCIKGVTDTNLNEIPVKLAYSYILKNKVLSARCLCEMALAACATAAGASALLCRKSPS